MLLTSAMESDYPAIIDLINLAFRGTGPDASWNTEVVFIEGPRLTESLFREELTAKSEAHFLIHREHPSGPILGTVLLDPKPDNTWYLGLLTIHPSLQKNHLGRALLSAAEDFARKHRARHIQMTVVNVRDTLIAWYQRRGYTLTSETRLFPYHAELFGRPLRND